MNSVARLYWSIGRSILERQEQDGSGGLALAGRGFLLATQLTQAASFDQFLASVAVRRRNGLPLVSLTTGGRGCRVATLRSGSYPAGGGRRAGR